MPQRAFLHRRCCPIIIHSGRRLPNPLSAVSGVLSHDGQRATHVASGSDGLFEALSRLLVGSGGPVDLAECGCHLGGAGCRGLRCHGQDVLTGERLPTRRAAGFFVQIVAANPPPMPWWSCNKVDAEPQASRPISCAHSYRTQSAGAAQMKIGPDTETPTSQAGPTTRNL